MARQPHHFTLTLDWDERSKRWKLTYVVQLGKGVASHWRWVESRGPVDAHGASLISDAVAQELASWLF